MKIRGLVAVATWLAHATSAGASTAYRCAIDGEARPACCCPAATGQATGRPSASPTSCCEVSVREAAPRPALSEAKVASSPPPGVSLEAWPCAPAGVAARAPRDGVPAWPGGAPLYLGIRTLII